MATQDPPALSRRLRPAATLNAQFGFVPMQTSAETSADEDQVMKSRLASPEPASNPNNDDLSDGGGDARMRGVSEEPATAQLATSSSSAAPNGSNATVQRNPSLRARDAFARLRIGSASGAPAAIPVAAAPPPPSNVGASTSNAGSAPTSPSSVTSSSSFSTHATGPGVPIANAINAGTGSGASLSRASSLRSPSLASATAPGMTHASPAASFLSAFSPPSSVGNRSPSPPPWSSAAGGSRRSMPAFGSVVLPPRGDQSGFKIVVPAGDDPDCDGEYEYVLGKELGRGGMGLVREATRRKIRRGGNQKRRVGRHSRDREQSVRGQEDAAMSQGEEDRGASDEAIATDTSLEASEEDDEEIKVAVKIIPRHQGHALPFSEAMGIRTGPGGGAGAPFAGDSVQRSVSLRQAPGSTNNGNRNSASSPLGGSQTSHVHRSFSLSQSQSPFGSSGQLLRHHPSQFSSTNSESDRTSALARAERNRSASSPNRKPALGLGPAFGTTGSGFPRPGTLSRGISLAAVEQSPLPTPSVDGDADSNAASTFGTSAPERDAGGFFARARASTVSHDSRLSSPREESDGRDGGADSKTSDSRTRSSEVDGHRRDIDLETAEPEDLLDLLLQREVSLWRQLSHLAPVPHTDVPMPRPTRFTDKGGHPFVVALLGTYRSDDFDYIFMPLAEGGTLLDYLNDPSSSSRSTSRSRSRSVSPSRSASPPASRGPGRSASRGRGRVNKPRPRASIPFAGSLSPPPIAEPQKKGLSLRRAGEIFLQIVDSLRWMHEEAGVVHRDLKLENVVGCWSVMTDQEIALTSGTGTGGGPAAEDGEGPITRGRSRSRMRQDYDHSLDSGYGRVTAARKYSQRRRRVWKLADFGLAELMPPSCAPSSAVQNVQPLAALARAGSLHRPDEGGRAGIDREQQQPPRLGLGSSVGPGSGLSQSAFLPRQPQHASTLPSPQQQHVHRPSPTSQVMGQQTVSPLSALLHPVGSLPYSSPEALRSSVPIVHPSGDIWALGCVLYALVSGRLPIWDEWELRLRVQLVKGEWEVPDELDPSRARSEEDRVEREMVLEVLRGCLEKDVDRRWTIRQVCDSTWIALVRQRERDIRAGRSTLTSALALQQADPAPVLPRRSSRTRSAAHSLGLFLDVQPSGSGRGSPARSANLSLGPSPSPTSPNADRTTSRGRPSTRSSSHSYGHGPPPAPSAGASGHHTDGASSPVIGRPNLPASDERGRPPKSASRSRTRLSTRSTSRSSAYAHQFGASGSELGEQERKERGRSERRRRWDEVGTSSGRRSVSRTSTGTSTSASGMHDEGSGLAGHSTPAELDEDLMLDEATEETELALSRASGGGGGGTIRRSARSASRRRPGASDPTHGREDSGGRSERSSHHLETVGEPY
ncbi:hypothetical protein BMF94_6073 [Rhodotorula taiwanensis]|uniref:non-specific serine/threonine protein kinase n=1 Tax=Rhodotorula taiwanensis TaxID=741276 RepID=A0A2S5B2A6_9BASI|nr:hypothetical protein BMF94_6073 [Rhodotorula taiwanensis]